MKKNIIALLICCAGMGAQHAIANTESYQGFYVGGGGWSTVSDTLYFNAGTYQLDGVWDVYSKAVWVSPAAVLQGAGKVVFHNAADATGFGLANSATVLDANNNTAFINVPMELRNSSNLELANLSPTPDMVNAGIATSGTADFPFANSFLFGVANGDVVTNNNRFILGNSASLVGYGVDRFVVTNHNDGELVKQGVSSGYFFPIGRAEGDFNPEHISVTVGAPVTYHTNVRSYTESIPNEALVQSSSDGYVARTWMVYGESPSNAIMDFIHPTGTPQEVAPYSIASSTVLRYDGAGGWIPALKDAEVPGSNFDASVPTGYWVQDKNYPVPTSALGSNSFYTKSSTSIILPLSLLRFGVAKNGKDALVEWATTMELNTSRFILERSSNGSQWQSIATLAAAGSSTNLRTYSYNDNAPVQGLGYYRLLTVDLDGRTSYSEIKMVNFGSGLAVAIYPNPASNTLIISGLSSNASFVKVFDAAGKLLILQATNGDLSKKIDISRFATGTYSIVVLENNKNATTIRFIKK